MLDKLLAVALTPAAIALDVALAAWEWATGPTPLTEVGGPYAAVDEIPL